jgi:molybdenum cofactor guanylyltransferase
LSVKDLSIAVLAGGQSRRMEGQDKAFATLKGVPFIVRVTREMRLISDELFVVIGKKDEERFRAVLDETVLIRKDLFDFDNPVSGMLTACSLVTKPLVGIIACDLPLINSEVIKFLASCIQGASASVPIWENGNIEPLCAVYKPQAFSEAALKAENDGARGCKNAVGYMKEVSYVPVSELRKIDPKLDSLYNVNLIKDFEALGH